MNESSGTSQPNLYEQFTVHGSNQMPTSDDFLPTSHHQTTACMLLQPPTNGLPPLFFPYA